MQLQGKIKQVNDTEVVSDKFKKRTIWLTTEDQYPQTIELQLTQDKCDLANTLLVGQVVTAHINIRGREWTNPQGETKVFNTIDCWKIDVQF